LPEKFFCIAHCASAVSSCGADCPPPLPPRGFDSKAYLAITALNLCDFEATLRTCGEGSKSFEYISLFMTLFRQTGLNMPCLTSGAFRRACSAGYFVVCGW